MNEPIINKIELSGIKTVDLLTFRPAAERLSFFDLSSMLRQDYFFNESEFKTALKALDLAQFKDRLVTIGCSNDAIVPYWAYLYLVTAFHPHSIAISVGTAEDAPLYWWNQMVVKADWSLFEGQKVVLKARNEIPPSIYSEAAARLLPHVKNLMWGEAGSPIMLYKARQP